MSQSLAADPHAMRTIAFALSIPPPEGTVKRRSSKQPAGGASNSRHEAAVAGPPAKACGGLGSPRATRPCDWAAIGRVDGLTSQRNDPEEGTSIVESSTSPKDIGGPSVPSVRTSGEVAVWNALCR